MGHHRVPLPRLGVRERLTGAHRDVLQRVLADSAAWKPGTITSSDQARVARVGGALHHDLGGAQGARRRASSAVRMPAPTRQRRMRGTLFKL